MVGGMTSFPSAKRGIFVATILAGSFLLFLVQPMVARMALPRLGGAPNVWNSAMLVYQALLLAGYGYAHLLSKYPLRRQATIHLALMVLAAVTLPIALVDLPSPAPGREVFWVPALLALTIGPVFFLVSAQAPLMQRWYAADPQAGEPRALYAASNIGSFTGLIACVAKARWNSPPPHDVSELSAEPVPAARIALWLALAAVPSGLMLSTTTHLTTDLFAMPLLWVIPLGIYLLSFVIAFASDQRPARAISALAPLAMLVAGGLAMVSRHTQALTPVLASIALLLIISVALHSRLYALRPGVSRLTLFYLVMSAGGALGGLFTALIAPLVFDWVWEHPILVLAAAVLLPEVRWLDWRRLPGLSPEMSRLGLLVALGTAVFLAKFLYDLSGEANPGIWRWVLTMAVSLCGLALFPWRWAFLAGLLALMLAQGGLETMNSTKLGQRSRSYFGIYTVRDYPDQKLRTLAHGTTLHGEQSFDPRLRRVPITYYGPGSGAGIVFGEADAVFGPHARIGVVGLGTGTLACYRLPGQDWRFYEIEAAVLRLSRNGTFTYIQDCAPDAKIVLGDARLKLAEAPRGSLDILAVDAFSSDSIPLHLLTDEAFGIYLDALSPSGILLVHISNRFIELEPVLAAEARQRGLTVALRDDNPQSKDTNLFTPSSWVLVTRDPAKLAQLRQLQPDLPWTPLKPPAPHAWTDDHASILPYVRWRNILGKL